MSAIVPTPAPGRYVIYNRVLAATGEKLAITFNGVSNATTATPLTYDGNQIVSSCLFIIYFFF